MDWTKNSSAVDHAIELIQKSGVLLENEIGEVCQKFKEKQMKGTGTHISAGPITYGYGDEDSALRQVDQVFVFHKEFQLSSGGGVQLRLQVVIEAKHRANTEIIGVRLPRMSYRPHMPQIGFIRGSRFEQDFKSESAFLGLPLAHPVLLNFKDQTPDKLVEEQIPYKSAASIYDYIQFDSDPTEEDFFVTLQEGDEISLLEEFKQYVARTNYAWWAVLRSWMSEHISDKRARKFFRKVPSARAYNGFTMYVPILCMSAPVRIMTNDNFAEAAGMMCRTRPTRWPGRLRPWLIAYTLEAPLLITNPTGLESLLTMASTWFAATESVFANADSAKLIRWPIESALFNAVLREFLPEEPFGNRLDESDLMNQI